MIALGRLEPELPNIHDCAKISIISNCRSRDGCRLHSLGITTKWITNRDGFLFLSRISALADRWSDLIMVLLEFPQRRPRHARAD